MVVVDSSESSTSGVSVVVVASGASVVVVVSGASGAGGVDQLSIHSI